MSTFLCLVDMSAQFPLFLSQRGLLLPFDSVAGENHHDGLIPRLLPVGRTAWSRFVLLSFY